MINFSLDEFLFAYRLLVSEHAAALAKGTDRINAKEEALQRNFKFIREKLYRFSSGELYARLQTCIVMVRSGEETYSALAYELGQIIQKFEDIVRIEGFFHYDLDDAERLRAVNREWGQAVNNFESLQDDVDAALDCLAMGHIAGCIFYMMRVAERGLRSLAKERGVKLKKNKPVEYAQWQEVITALQDQVKIIGQTAPAGPGKEEALSFYATAVADLIALKDKFRNAVSHLREKPFSREDALEAIEITRRLMAGLSTRLYDDTKKPIRWKF